MVALFHTLTSFLGRHKRPLGWLLVVLGVTLWVVAVSLVYEHFGWVAYLSE